MSRFKILNFTIVVVFLASTASAQKSEPVRLVKSANEKKVDIFIDDKLFTSFLYPDTLEKPVLFPIHAANGAIVTRGFPLDPRPGEPNDHPHHVGLWFNFENVNGLDFLEQLLCHPERKKTSIWLDTYRPDYRSEKAEKQVFWYTMPTG